METLPLPEFGEQICVDCHQRLTLSEFYKARTMRLGVSRVCKQCDRKRTREWRDQNYDKYLDGHLRRTFGITLEQYNEMVAEQGGVCAICGQPPSIQTMFKRNKGSKARPRLAVDHDHATGRVRGLLCELCNCGIGLLRDDPVIIRLALRYLEGGARYR